MKNLGGKLFPYFNSTSYSGLVGKPTTCARALNISNLNGVLDAELDVDGREVAEEENAVVELGREEPISEPEEDGQRHAERERGVAQKKLKKKKNVKRRIELRSAGSRVRIPREDVSLFRLQSRDHVCNSLNRPFLSLFCTQINFNAADFN